MRQTLALVVAAVTAALSSASTARDLTIVSWGGAYQDAQRQVYFQPFTQATGVRIVEDSWDGGIGVLRTRAQAGNQTWDLVQVESEELLLGCDEGLFEKIDWARVGGKDHYIPEAVHECGVGAILKPVFSWAVFFLIYQRLAIDLKAICSTGAQLRGATDDLAQVLGGH